MGGKEKEEKEKKGLRSFGLAMLRCPFNDLEFTPVLPNVCFKAQW